MTSALNFIHTLLADTNTKWDTFAQALVLFDSTQLLPKPTDLPLSEDQNALLNYLSACFVDRHRFKEDVQEHVVDISVRDNHHGFYNTECVKFIIEYFGVTHLTTVRSELNNRSFLTAFCQTNINMYQQNIPHILLWMEQLGTCVFESIRVENKNETYDSLLGCMFEKLTDRFGPHFNSDQRRFSTVLVNNETNIANATYGSIPGIAYFCTQQLWDLYIRHGGDPDVEVPYNYTSKPLWEALVAKSDDNKSVGLSTHLRNWGKTHNKNVQKIIESAYFTRLNSKIGNYQRRYQDIKDTVTSSPNWADFEDNEGRTPMMSTVAAHKSAYKIFSAKKYRSQLEKRDNQGRNVLAYALKDANKITPEALQFLFSIPSLLTLPEDGRGLIQHVNDFNTGLRGVGNYFAPEDDALRLEQLTTWFGAPQHHTCVANVIANRYFYDPAYQSGISRLVRLGATKVIKNRALRGALVLCVAGNLAQNISNYNRSYTWKPNDQLDPHADVKQIRANNLLNKYVHWLEKLLETAVAPEFQNDRVQQKWSEVLPISLFQSIGCDYTFTTLCNRMSKNALNNALQNVEAHSEPHKSRKL